MDPFGRNHSLNSKANLNSSEVQRGKDFSKKVAETDENEFHLLQAGAPTKLQVLKTDIRKNALFSNTSFSFKNKILAERKEDLLPDSPLSLNLEITPHSKYLSCVNPSGESFHNSPISLHSYDPITNYTSPRPKFLRYNPIQRRELLQRIEAEKGDNEEVGAAFFPSSPSSSSKRGNDNDNENEEEEEEEELEEGKPWYSCVVWSLVFIFGGLFFIFYCTRSSSYPSFEGFESSATNIQKIQGKVPLTLVGKSLFTEIFLENLVSFSQMCPIVRESLCNLNENLFVSPEIDKFIGRQRSGEREWLKEGIRYEFSDKTEDLVAKDQDLLFKNGGLVDDDTVVKGQREHGDQNQRDSGSLAEEGNAKQFISRGFTLKENNITGSSVESLLVSLSQEISDSSFTIRDKFHNESFDSMEFPWTSQSRVDLSTPTGDQGLEDFSSTLSSDTKLADYSSNILSEGALRTFSFFIGSFTILVGLLICFHKYVRKPNSNPFLPSFVFFKKWETREKIVRKKEENLDKALDISVESKSSRLHADPSPLDYVNVELKEVSGFGPPSVKLLGEFSLIDAKATNNGFGSNLKKMEYPNSQVSYYKQRRASEKLSPLADMLVSSPEESTSSRFSSKVPADKGGRSDTSATSSLRRSSRLQNRNRNRLIFP